MTVSSFIWQTFKMIIVLLILCQEGENKETEATSNEENELLDILAGEIYNLLQQRIEIERERQGKYYR